MVNRLSPQITNVLAQYKDISTYVPKIGDKIEYSGLLWGRWNGIVLTVKGDSLTVLNGGGSAIWKNIFTTPEAKWPQNSIELSLTDLRSSRGGKYTVIQDSVFYIDD